MVIELRTVPPDLRGPDLYSLSSSDTDDDRPNLRFLHRLLGIEHAEQPRPRPLPLPLSQLLEAAGNGAHIRRAKSLFVMPASARGVWARVRQRSKECVLSGDSARSVYGLFCASLLPVCNRFGGRAGHTL